MAGMNEESPRLLPLPRGFSSLLVIAGGLARPRATSGPLLRDAVPAGNCICVGFPRRAPKPRNLDVTSDCTSGRSGSRDRTTSFRQNLREGPDLGTPSGIATRMSHFPTPSPPRVSLKFCLLFADKRASFCGFPRRVRSEERHALSSLLTHHGSLIPAPK